jgi:putative MATE family efflux protein
MRPVFFPAFFGLRRGKMQKTDDFTSGKILAPLLRFSMPIFFAVFLQAMYGAVDLLIVGQFSDSTGVSAVATGSLCMQTVTGIVTGLTMGITILISKKLGELHLKEAADVIGTSICLFAVIGIAISITMALLSSKFAYIMQIPSEAFDGMTKYVKICSFGALFIVAYNVISGIMRGLGNSKLPLLFVFVACIVNIAGDLILVGIFDFGASGAATATVGAQAVSVLFSIAVIKKTGLPFKFSVENIKFCKKYLLMILKLGLPIAMQDALVNVSYLILIAIVNTLGLVASAAVGVGEKIVIFLMLIPFSYMSSVSTFVARNIGAGKPERAKKCLYYVMGTSIVFGLAMFGISFFRGDILAGIFSKDSTVIAACAMYMKSYAFDCLLVSFLFCFVGYFNGYGKTFFVLIQSVAASFLVRVPISYVMSKKANPSLFFIGLASPVATASALTACIVYFVILNRNSKEDIDLK